MTYLRALLERFRARLHRLLGRGTDKLIIPVHAPPGPRPKKAPPAPDPSTRALERARLRQDVFVVPEGPKPVAKPRKERQPKPVTPPPPSLEEGPIGPEPKLDNELFVVGKINDVDEAVLVKETELYGEFNFRDSILDQLDRYWVYLARMKHHDPDAYGFYKTVGATIVPRVATHTHWHNASYTKLSPTEIAEVKASIKLPPWFRAKRPAFGCIAYGAHSLSEGHELRFSEPNPKGLHLWIPKFMYYVKYNKPPPEIQPAKGGDVFKMTIWWDRPQDKHRKWGTPEEFAVFVNAEGTDIQILRMLDTRIVTVPKKHSSWEVTNIPQRAWHIPNTFNSWAASLGIDPQLHMKDLFCTAIREQEVSNYSMIRVAVTKGDMTAVFGVAIHRTAYFFQDRDYELTEHGTRKRIFHIVRPHTRADGTIVKMHFRGARTFHWAGYDVEITVPGLDHFMMNEFEPGTIDSYWLEPGQKYVTQPELGRRLKQQMHDGLGGMKERRK